MYERRDRNTTSSYYPAFLFLSLDSPDSIDNLFSNDSDERLQALFVHEYTHYLQDITTYSGLIEIITKIDRIKWAVIEATKQKEIVIPFHPNTEQSYHIADNYLAHSIAEGSGKSDQLIEEVLEFRLERAILTVSGKKEEKNLTALLKFKTPYGEIKTYNVGAYAISESMAYLIEHNLYTGVIPNSIDCPYQIVQKLVHHYIPQYEDRLSMIAMCDVCLQTPFPGATFYNIVQLLLRKWNHKKREEFFTPEDIIEKIGLTYQFLKRNSIDYLWPSYLEEKGDQASKQLQDFFTPSYWKGNKDLIGQILSHAINYRIKNPFLMLDIAKGGKICHNIALQGFYSACGIPCIINANDEVYQVIPHYCAELDVEPELFVNLHSLHSILLTEEASNNFNIYKCPLINHCHSSYEKKAREGIGPVLEDLTVKEDEFCLQRPWKNKDAPSGLNNCSFARLWATYNLPTIHLSF